MSDRREFLDLIDPAVAGAAIAAFGSGGTAESVPLDAADAHVLAERVRYGEGWTPRSTGSTP